MKFLFDYWDSNHIGLLRLASVGIVIGCQYVAVITQEKYDLNIWILVNNSKNTIKMTDISLFSTKLKFT